MKDLLNNSQKINDLSEEFAWEFVGRKLKKCSSVNKKLLEDLEANLLNDFV